MYARFLSSDADPLTNYFVLRNWCRYWWRRDAATGSTIFETEIFFLRPGSLRWPVVCPESAGC